MQRPSGPAPATAIEDATGAATTAASAASADSALDCSLAAIRRSYRLFAPLYDVVFGASLEHGRRVAIEALRCRPGDRILEVGVGSGLSLRHYPRGVQLTGIDLSEDMLAKAATRLQCSSVVESTALLSMDAGRMRFADASFDKAVLLFTVAGLPDPVRALREVARVCRPGATIVIASHFRSRRRLVSLCDGLLAPIYRLLRYRDDLDGDALVEGAGLQAIEARPVNLFGYSTVLVCRSC